MCDAHYRSGLALMALGRSTPPRRRCAAPSRSRPISPRAGQSRRALHRLKRLDEAAAYFRRALEIRARRRPGAQQFRAMLHDLVRSDEAGRQLPARRRDRSRLCRRPLNLGLAPGRQRRFDAAVASLRRAVALKPDSAEAQHALASLSRTSVARRRVAMLRKTIAAEARLCRSPLAGDRLARVRAPRRQPLASASRARRAAADLPGALSQAPAAVAADVRLGRRWRRPGGRVGPRRPAASS